MHGVYNFGPRELLPSGGPGFLVFQVGLFLFQQNPSPFSGGSSLPLFEVSLTRLLYLYIYQEARLKFTAPKTKKTFSQNRENLVLTEFTKPAKPVLMNPSRAPVCYGGQLHQ